MRLPDAIPGDARGWQLRLEPEDLEDGAAGHPDPADLATRCLVIVADPEEAANTLGGRIGHANQRAPEHVGVELHEAVEVGHRDADVTERLDLHVRCAAAGIAPAAASSARRRSVRRR